MQIDKGRKRKKTIEMEIKKVFKMRIWERRIEAIKEMRANNKGRNKR